MARVVVDMNDQRPMWARPDWFEHELRAALPDDWSLAVLDVPAEGTGDGSTAAHPEVLEAVADAEIYMGFGIHPDVIEAGPGIRWVHSGSAGVGSSLSEPMLGRAPVFTNTAGIHAEPIADTALGMILHFFRGFDFAVRAQHCAMWDTHPFYEADSPVRELAGATVGIVGYGGIGRALARRLRALDVHVIGLRKHADGEEQEGVEIVTGSHGFDRVLRESDAIVLTAPETEETRGMIDADAFARMRPSAVLLNVARGSLIVEEELLNALARGTIRGAGLDVFATEPLPHASPIWGFANVLVTPHVSGVTDRFWRRETDLVLHNVERWLAGDVEGMRNRVDLDAGY